MAPVTHATPWALAAPPLATQRLIRQANGGSTATYVALARAFGWPPEPRKECGADGFEGIKAPCTARPFGELRKAFQQHADSCCGGGKTLDALLLDLRKAEEADSDDEPALWALKPMPEGEVKVCMMHLVLAQALRPVTQAPKPTERVPAAKQALVEEISWPPLVMVESIGDRRTWGDRNNEHSAEAANSKGKLLKRFGDFGPTIAVPLYTPEFNGKAVLGFSGAAGAPSEAEAGGGAHKFAFEQAKNLLGNLNSDATMDVGRARWVTKAEYDSWSLPLRVGGNPPKWPKEVLRWATTHSLRWVNKHEMEQLIVEQQKAREKRSAEEAEKSRAAQRQLEEELAQLNTALTEDQTKMERMRHEFFERTTNLMGTKEKELAEARRKATEAAEQKSVDARRETKAMHSELERATEQMRQKERERQQDMVKSLNEACQNMQIDERDKFQRKLEQEREIWDAGIKEEQRKMQELQSTAKGKEVESLRAELEKQKKKSEEERSQKEMFEEFYNRLTIENRVLKDATSSVDEILLGSLDKGGFKDDLASAHRVRVLGEPEMVYAMELGLKEEDVLGFTIWETCYRGYTDKETGFNPNTAFTKQASGKLGVCEDDAWVKAFRHRYKRCAKDRPAANQILEYLCEKYEEKEASGGTYYYEKYITKHCVNRGCEALGYCEGKSATRFRDTDGEPLPNREAHPDFKVGGRLVERTKVEATPKEKLKLLLALQRRYPKRCYECSE